ncbi:Argininosuccinate lyase [Peptoniphilus harei]|uniref:Argininosuccinate lyase n=1 Tax=Peptoniphilus harei TaxID=54005 RepID=A0A2X1WZF4_9FIRM|nr:lyase family protein [Peptoniphilus harei]SPY36237.1 Argininosuccinate lyase [Peptoniphilus harei]
MGKKLHTARSRNDQCALDLKLYSKKVLAEINKDLKNLIKAIISLAEENKNTIMPGLPTCNMHKLLALLIISLPMVRCLKKILRG